MDEEKILASLAVLAGSVGRYGRLLNDLNRMKRHDPEEYRAVMDTLIAQNFSSVMDLIMFIEQ